MTKCFRLLTSAAVMAWIVPSVADAGGIPFVNQLGNNSFEMPDASGGATGPITGWFEFGAPDTRFVTQEVPADDGLQTLKMFGPFDFIGGGTGVGQTLPASPGETWVAEVSSRNDSSDPIGTGNFTAMKIEFLDGGFGPVGGSFTAGVNVFEVIVADEFTPKDQWNAFGVGSAPAPAGTEFANMILVHVQGAPSITGGAVFLDNASMFVIPEPSSVTLALMGLAGMVGLIRYRRKTGRQGESLLG